MEETVKEALARIAEWMECYHLELAPVKIDAVFLTECKITEKFVFNSSGYDVRPKRVAKHLDSPMGPVSYRHSPYEVCGGKC